MSIGQIGKKIVKTIRVISEAEPRRVSIVANGANQTPFRELKSAEPPTDQEATNKEIDEMPNENAKKSGAGLVRITFSTDKFTTEKAVKSWMEDRGYEVPESVDKGVSAYSVTSPSFKDAEEENVRVIEVEDGVTYHLVKSEDGKSEDDETVAVYDSEGNDVTEKYTDEEGKVHSPEDVEEEFTGDPKELSEKINDMRVYFSEKRKMKDVLKDADDGMPIGTGDVYQLFTKALMNAAESGDTDAVKSVSAEFGEMFTEMMDVTNKFISQASSDAEDAEKSATKKSEDEAVEDEAKATEDGEEASKQEQADDDATVAPEEGAEDESGDAEEEEKSANKESKATDKVDTDKSADPKEESPSLEEQVAKAVEKAFDFTTLTNALKGLSEKMDEIGDRVEELESVEQSRKGADDDLGSPSTKKEPELSRLQKNAWGL